MPPGIAISGAVTFRRSRTRTFSIVMSVIRLRRRKTPIGAVERNRMRGWLTVVGRDLRWRMEDIEAAYQQGSYSLVPPVFGLYRNVSNGDMLLDANPAYVASGNKPMR